LRIDLSFENTVQRKILKTKSKINTVTCEIEPVYVLLCTKSKAMGMPKNDKIQAKHVYLNKEVIGKCCKQVNHHYN